MVLLKFLIVFLILNFLVQQTIQQICKRNVNKLLKENRRCGHACIRTRPCRNQRAKCRCDGSCGLVCIAPEYRCVTPDSIKNGSVYSETYFFMSVTQYFCDDGFELIGSEFRVCRSDTKWSGQQPVCVKSGLRCKPPEFKFYTLPIREEYFEGDKFRYRCDIQEDLLETTCTVKDGVASWASINTSCSHASTNIVSNENLQQLELRSLIAPKNCSKPDDIQNGYYKGENFSSGQKVEYNCNLGYILFGENILVCHVGRWSNSTPSCKPVTCETPDEIPNGKMTFTAPLEYRSNITYDCDNGFLLTGDRLLQCHEDGEWIGIQPNCSKADCGTPKEPDNGRIVNFNGSKVDDQVDYECSPHSTSNSTMSAVCTFLEDTAKWSIPPPICLKDCEVIALENVVVKQNEENINVGSFVQHGTLVHFQCIPGFEISSTTTKSENMIEVKCEDGVWSSSITCGAAHCFESSIQILSLNKLNLQLPDKMPTTIYSGTKISLNINSKSFQKWRLNEHNLQLPNGNSKISVVANDKDGDFFLSCDHGSWIYPNRSIEQSPEQSTEKPDLEIPLFLRKIDPIILKKNDLKKNDPILQRENDTIILKKNDPIILRENDTIILRENDPIILKKNDTIILKKNDTIILKKNDTIILKKNDPIILAENDPIILKKNDLKKNDSIILKKNDLKKKDPIILRKNDPIILSSEFGSVSFEELESDENTPEDNKLGCSFEINDKNLVAYKDGQVINQSRLFYDGDTLKFRCSNISLHSLVGSSDLECKENRWNDTIPTCMVLSFRDPYKPPVVTYTLDNCDESYIGENGSLFVSENTFLKLDCWWFRNRYGPAVWLWNGKVVRSEFTTEWTSVGNYVLYIKKMTELTEGLYLCENPKRQSHGIDIRIVREEENLINEETTTTETILKDFTMEEAKPTEATQEEATPGDFMTEEAKPTEATQEEATPGDFTTEEAKPTETTSEDLSPTFSCAAMNNNNLDIFENGHEVLSKKKYFDKGSTLVFRCNDEEKQKLVGNNKIQCNNGKWSRIWPRCRGILANDWNSPPPVTVHAPNQIKRLYNGDYLVDRGAGINFICDFVKKKPFMNINGKEVTNTIKMKIAHNNSSWIVHMKPVHIASLFTFKCYIPLSKRVEKFSNMINVRVGDSCELSENAAGEKFQNAVFMKSTLQPFYAERDKVLFKCEKLGVNVRLPHGMRCGKNGVWDVIREPQISCR